MKQNKLIKRAWISTIIYLIVGLIGLLWGGVKNIGNFYGISLIIALFLPIIYAFLITCKVKVPTGFGLAVIYLLIIITLSFAYQIQSFWGYLILPFVVILYAVLAIFYALFKTLRNRKQGQYYYVDGKQEKLYPNFRSAFKEYYLEGITSGIIDGILTIILGF